MPKLGLGGCIPTPTQLKNISTPTIVPILIVILTINGLIALGKICLNNILGVDAPKALAASTYGDSLRNNT
jgi:hypothetical protein